MSDDRFRLLDTVVTAALDHALGELPNEACGLVSGRGGIGRTFHPARNAVRSPYRFDLHPEDLVRLLHEIEAAGDELVATFHSHPVTDAVPSATDRREARYPVPQLIATLAGGTGEARLRAWSVEAGESRELRLEVSPGPPQQSVASLETMRGAMGSSAMSTAHEPSSFPDR